MRRNKVDGKGRHPWKAEVSEDDSGVNTTTIGNWYKEGLRACLYSRSVKCIGGGCTWSR